MKMRILAGACVALLIGGAAYLLSARPQDAAKETAKVAAKPAEGPRIAASRIAQVTVYPNSALVTREVDVPAGQGTLELIVSPLPEMTITSSLYSEGSDDVRVLTTRFRTRPVEEDTREEVRKLQDEARKLQLQGQKVQGDLKACENNLALLGKLEGFTSVSTNAATEKGKMDADATIQLTKYVMEGRMDKTREIVRLQQEAATIADQMAFSARKLQELSAGSSKTERDAVVVVDKVNAAAGKVKLSYLVDAAAWRPQYKLRAGKTAKDNVQLEYLAAIMQQTGEDWNNVAIQLSTAQPMLSAAPPELNVLAVNVVPRNTPVAANPNSLAQFRGQGIQGGGGQFGGIGGIGGGGYTGNTLGRANGPPASQGQPAVPQPAQPQFDNELLKDHIDDRAGNYVRDLNEDAANIRLLAQDSQNRNYELARGDGLDNNTVWNYAGALEQARDLVLVPDEKSKPSARFTARGSKNEGPSVTYPLPHRISVPSRNDEQVLEVARIDMAPDYFYKAVPILSPHVYRQANLVNKSTYVLLPGEATMYNGADFVGRMNLPLVAIGEQFTIGFGTEPQLQVSRQMVEKTRSMQGGNQIIKFEYRILLSSYKGEKVRVQVWDRLPFAEGGETLGVTLVKSTPELSKDALYVREERPSNLLRWDVEVAPEQMGEKAFELSYEFKLELDKQMSIGTFQTKTK